MDKAKNRKTVRMLVFLAIGMFAFAFALVPLYDLFCQVTGVRGTGPEAEPTSLQADKTRLVLVEFDGIVDSNLPWEFEPTKRSLEVHPGEVASVSYRVTNLANEDVTGQAVPSVIPWFGAEYLKKMACFCFSNQTLKAGETKDMPLRFYVSKDIPKDINTLRLSYSFFNTNNK